MDTNDKYTLTAIILHWLVAVLVFALFAIGLYMVELPADVVPSVRKPWFELHKSLGLTVFILLLLRLIWRLGHPPPSLPDSISAAQQSFISSVHKLFYLAMFLQPISGYLSSSFSGYKTKLFGLPLPHWGWKQEQLNDLFSEIHEISAAILATFIAIHLCGIFMHKLKGSGASIMRRMLP